MSEKDQQSAYSPWQNMMYLCICMLFGFFVGLLITRFFSLQISLKEATSSQILFTLMLSSCCIFVLPGWWFLVRRRTDICTPFKWPRPYVLLLVSCIACCAIILNAVVIEWNKMLPPPPWLREWITKQQEENYAIVQHLLVSHTHFDYLVRLFVMAIVPAVGEELIFRYILQRELIRLTGNVHAGILWAALLFSVFHFEWIGIFPRLLLGMLFGYLYYISSSFSTAVWAHFLNNGCIVTWGYLCGLDIIDCPKDASGAPDMGAGESPDAIVVILALIAFTVLFGIYWRYHRVSVNERT